MLPLEGLIVVSVEQAVAAPFCSSRLADAGAHVIKVERPEGDFARGYDAAAKGQSSYFVWLNRGKNSVVIDLATKDGRADLEALIASADVLLQNLKPGSMDKLGFSLERLKRDYPALICCTISGYGDDGPYADRKAYDLLIQAESGLASITGGPEGPSRVGISVVDIATGATAHASILEALIARGRTGKGADIRISMFDVMADWMAVPLINSEAGNPPKRMALAHPSIAPYGVFNSKDGKGILISIQSEREWKKLCAEVLGQPDLPNDPRFANMVERVRNRALTDKTVADSFAAMTRVELLKRLDEADIAFAEVNTMADLAVHPHLRRIEVDTPNGKVSYAAPAAIFVDEERHYGAVPAIGDHVELAQSSPCQEPPVMTQAAEKLDLDHLRQWIGRSTEATDIVTAQLVKGLRATLFQDIGEPKAGDAAPWTTHWCLAQPVFPMSMLGPDGHPTRGGFLPPVPLPRRMWAGGEIEFIEPLRVGDESTRTSRISDVTHEDRLDRHALLRLRRAHRDDAARCRDPRTPGHRLSRHGRRGPGCTSQGASAGARGKASRNPCQRSRAAVSLFGADLQRPPHPLRPRLRHQGRGLSGPGLPRPLAGGADRRVRGQTARRHAAAEIQLSRRAALVRRHRILDQRQRYQHRHGPVDRECRGTADDEGHGCVVRVRHSGAMRSIEPGISRFRVWCLRTIPE